MSFAVIDRPTSAKPPVRGRSVFRWPLAALVVIGGVLWQGSIRTPAGPANGTLFRHADQSTTVSTGSNKPARQFRIGTYNIRRGRGLDGHENLDRIADTLRGVDFVGLNEVGSSFWASDPDQAEVLGRKLNVDWLFAPTERRWWHDHFGNGVLSRLPVRWWQRVPLDDCGSRSSRSFVLVGVEVSGRPLTVLVAHIDHGSIETRSVQLQAVVDLFLSLAEPAALVGDLNAAADDPQLARLLATPGVRDAMAGLAGAEPHIDWIVLKGIEALDRGMVAPGPSDHPHFWVECRVVDSK